MGSAAQSQSPATTATDDQAGASALEADTLVEEISIDGMCGVY